MFPAVAFEVLRALERQLAGEVALDDLVLLDEDASMGAPWREGRNAGISGASG